MMSDQDALTDLPEWVERVVLLDTNAYRELAGRGHVAQAVARAKSLARAEQAAGICALACPTVLMELIAHLSDPSDPAYQSALGGLTAAAVHCRMSDNGESHVAIAPSPDLQLCHTLWDRWPDKLLRIDNIIRGLTEAVSRDPTEAGLASMREDLTTAAEAVAKSEVAFAESMRQHLIENLRAQVGEAAKTAPRKDLLNAFRRYLESPEARQMVAEAHVRRAMGYLEDLSESDEEVTKKGQRVADWFSVAVELYLRITRKIAESNWDLTTGKGGNHLWDLQVAFLIGTQHNIQGRPILVVSADSEIIEAAVDAGANGLVESYQAYRSAFPSVG